MRVFALGALLALALSGCLRVSEEEAEACRKIGAIISTTGSLGPLGPGIENAARLAVADLNVASAEGRTPWCLVALDDGSSDAQVPALVDQLLDQFQVEAIAGAIGSAASIAVQRQLERRAVELPVVSCCSTSPVLSTFPNYFRTAPSDALQGSALAGLLIEDERKSGKVAVIFVDNSYGRSFAESLADDYQRRGGGAIELFGFVPDESVGNAHLDALKRVDESMPDTIVMIAYPADGANILTDWAAIGGKKNVVWYAGESLASSEFVSAAGAAAVGIRGTKPMLGRPEIVRGFEESYRQAFGERPDLFASSAYDAVLLLGVGLLAAGPDATGAEQIAAVREISRAPGAPVEPRTLGEGLVLAEAGDIDLDGVSGALDLDAQGDPSGAYRVWSVDARLNVVDADECWACPSDVCERTPCP